MKIITKSMSELKLAERNVRLHGERQIKEYIRSIEMFGQVRPLVIDENNVVLCGNGLLQALQKMGKESADCYVMVGLDNNKKKKLMLADNKIYELGANNQVEFDNILRDLSGDIDIPGYDEELLKVLTASAKEAEKYISAEESFNEESAEEVHNAKSPHITMTVQKNSPASQPVQENLNNSSEIGAENFADEKFCTCPKCGFKFNV